MPDTRDSNEDRRHVRPPTTAETLEPLGTAILWHPNDRERVEQALAAALGALADRTSSDQLILDDPNAYGLTDPAAVRAQVEGDDEAATVLRQLLHDGIPSV